MSKSYGSKTWFIPDCYYPEHSSGVFPSHEAICVLNPAKEDAVLQFTLYFEDREKVEGFTAECKGERTHHIRLDRLKDAEGNGIPQGVPYALMVESNINVVLQYSRMDTTQSEMALMTTLGYGV